MFFDRFKDLFKKEEEKTEYYTPLFDADFQLKTYEAFKNIILAVPRYKFLCQDLGNGKVKVVSFIKKTNTNINLSPYALKNKIFVQDVHSLDEIMDDSNVIINKKLRWKIKELANDN